MISRVADHCFWFGRYVERAEATARTLSATASLALDAELEPAQVWRPVVVVSGEEDEFRERVAEGADHHPAWGDGEIVQRFMVWDEQNGVSLDRSISGARWNARSIREVLSLEAWETVNELHLWFTTEAQGVYAHQRDAFYQHVRRSTQLTLGLLRSTMLHDEPLDFIWLGVLLERVSQTARMLDVHHHAFTNLYKRHDLVETALWLSLLRALSGSEAYMKRSAGRISSDAVARFLICEDAFPRSIAYCVHSAYDRLCDIRPPEKHELPGGMSLERLRVLDAWVTARTKDPLAGSSVHDLLTHVVDEVHAICGTLGKELLGAG
ncbi:MAG: alpha-E domain-containing protein [Kofleriaceae bacterium]|nr:alpha-E domain-containing protein [Kofleriaceae bacterium]